MKIISVYGEGWTSCGPVLWGIVEVSGEKFNIEGDLEKTWVNIIDKEGRAEGCDIHEDGYVTSERGETVTQTWTDKDWEEFTEYVGAKEKGEE